jgi:uncharacterized membrane protein (UPF0127 family)
MIRFWYIGVLVLVLFFILGWYFFGFNNKLIYKKTTVVINNKEFRVDISDNVQKRSKGLSGRNFLAENEGMLFLFSTSSQYGFWMKDMNFPIDIIWIKNNKIVDISKNILPEPQKSIFNLTVYYPKEEVDKVLEINAGLSDKYNFQIGDEVKINL